MIYLRGSLPCAPDMPFFAWIDYSGKEGLIRHRVAYVKSPVNALYAAGGIHQCPKAAKTAYRGIQVPKTSIQVT